ncbi:MAG: hypothetical protein U0573_11610 [Phycisphaerales bacterium]
MWGFSMGTTTSNNLPRTLVISDGSVASLLACAGAREAIVSAGGDEKAARPIVLFVPVGDETNRARRQAVERQAKLYELDMADMKTDLRGPGAHGSFGAGLSESIHLITATYQAAQLGCDVVVWPVQFAGVSDVEKIARASDRALLVTRLASLDSTEHGKPAVRVETPFADFTDRQMADLAIDMNVPVELCWWWEGKDEHALQRIERWVPVLQSLGWSPSRSTSRASA